VMAGMADSSLLHYYVIGNALAYEYLLDDSAVFRYDANLSQTTISVIDYVAFSRHANVHSNSQSAFVDMPVEITPPKRDKQGAPLEAAVERIRTQSAFAELPVEWWIFFTPGAGATCHTRGKREEARSAEHLDSGDSGKQAFSSDIVFRWRFAPLLTS